MPPKPPAKPVKIIFLDIDGVLNSAQSMTMHARHNINGSRVFCPLAVSNLKRILDDTDARIVISSTWRKYYSTEQLAAIFEQYDIGYGHRFDYNRTLMDITPTTFSHLDRGLEIKRWFKHYEDCENPDMEQGFDCQEAEDDAAIRRDVLKNKRFVIIDDDSDMKPYMDRLVQTNGRHGLMWMDADKAIEMLGGKDGRVGEEHDDDAEGTEEGIDLDGHAQPRSVHSSSDGGSAEESSQGS